MTVFSDLENALAPYVGGADASGAILGLTVIIIAFVGFRFLFGQDFLRSQTGLIIMLVIIGFVSAPGVDWFPLWVPFLVVLIIAIQYWHRGL
jgi:uncharacterized membrane protein